MSKLNKFVLKNNLWVSVIALTFNSPVWADEIIRFTIHGEPAYYVGEKVNPELTHKRGGTYQIQMNTPGHPLWIKTVQSAGADTAYSKGITGNGTDRGTITFVVPTDAPDHLVYNCQYHIVMHGIINITN